MVSQIIENAQADPVFAVTSIVIFLVFIVALGFASKGI